MPNLWNLALKTGASLALIGALLFYSLSRDWLKLRIFSRLTHRQTLRLMTLFLVLTFLLALALIGAQVWQATLPALLGHQSTATPRSLQIDIIGSGSGSVGSAAARFDGCSRSCKRDMDAGKTMILIATPDPQSVFQGWRGACKGTGTCSVDPNQDHQIEAVFIQTSELVVKFTGAGVGTVNGTLDTSSALPHGREITSTFSCQANCKQILPRNSRITFHAAPGIGSYFAGWQDHQTGAKSTDYQITIEAATLEVTARFLRTPKTGCRTTFVYGDSDRNGRMVFRKCECPGQEPVLTSYGRRVPHKVLGDGKKVLQATADLVLPDPWPCAD